MCVCASDGYPGLTGCYVSSMCVVSLRGSNMKSVYVKGECDLECARRHVHPRGTALITGMQSDCKRETSLLFRCLQFCASGD